MLQAAAALLIKERASHYHLDGMASENILKWWRRQTSTRLSGTETASNSSRYNVRGVKPEGTKVRLLCHLLHVTWNTRSAGDLVLLSGTNALYLVPSVVHVVRSDGRDVTMVAQNRSTIYKDAWPESKDALRINYAESCDLRKTYLRIRVFYFISS